MKLSISIAVLITLLSPSHVGWQESMTPISPPYVMSDLIESKERGNEYLLFCKKQMRHGSNTCSYEKKNNKWYFMRENKECKFW